MDKTDLSSDRWIRQNMNVIEDNLLGFSWPQRQYTCSFCRREFKSAQALGGHMNIHRRERAGLRQNTPSWLLRRSNPNPNTTVHPSMTCSSPSLIPSEKSSMRTFMGFGDVKQENCLEKKGKVGNLDLEIGLLSDQINDNDLDLELRLGYSN